MTSRKVVWLYPVDLLFSVSVSLIMTTVISKVACVKCKRSKNTVNCSGCARDFCLAHINDHYKELSEQQSRAEDQFKQIKNNLCWRRKETRMVFVRSPLFSPPFTRLCIGIYTMREQRIRRTKDNRKRREQKRDDIQVISSDKEREASRDRDDLGKSLDHPLTYSRTQRKM